MRTAGGHLRHSGDRGGQPLVGSRLRKLRWARPGRGKSGGVRVVCYWAPAEEAFYKLYAYAKNEQGDLTPAHARALGQLVQEEFQ